MKNQINSRKISVKTSGKGSIVDTKTEKPAPEKTDDSIITDPFGSWTGIPVDITDGVPVQDVDDL